MIATGHYAELYQKRCNQKRLNDFNQKSFSKNIGEKDTMYMHGKKIIVSGPQRRSEFELLTMFRFTK